MHRGHGWSASISDPHFGQRVVTAPSDRLQKQPIVSVTRRDTIARLLQYDLGVPNPSRTSFRTTAWSVVLAAARSPTKESRDALASLCQTYWNPVYAFIRRSGHSRDQSEDLAQGFFALLLEKEFLRAVDPRRGRFRSFLLTAVKHFLANEWDRAHAVKRGGGRVLVPLDVMEAESWYARAAIDDVTPERLFERRWALSLVDHVMARLRADYSAAGKAEQFDRLQALLTRDSPETGYETLAAELGGSAGALRMAVHRLRRKYRQALRAEIAKTVSDAQQVDEEIRFLMSVL
jgi:DNA-directed RNA polymerase specialized sigma24 family protein